MIERVLTKFATSRVGSSLYKFGVNPKNETFINNNLPQIETVLSTACYVWSTARRKEIDSERRTLLQIQNIGSGIVGLTISSWASRQISKYGEKVINGLDSTKFSPKDLRKVSTGLKIGLPILTTCVCMRFLIPSFIALFSGKIMDKSRENKLDKKI